MSKMRAKSEGIPVSDSLEMILDRHVFYKRRYRLILITTGILFAAMVGSLVIMIHGITSIQAPRYFVVDAQDDTPMALSPVSEPIYSDYEIAQWASDRVMQLYTYNWISYRRELSDIRGYMLEQTWDDYLDGLERENFFGYMAQNKLRLFAENHPEHPIRIESLPASREDGRTRYSWNVVVPVHRSISWVDSTVYNPMDVNRYTTTEIVLRIIRVKETRSPDRILIFQIAECEEGCDIQGREFMIGGSR